MAVENAFRSRALDVELIHAPALGKAKWQSVAREEHHWLGELLNRLGPDRPRSRYNDCPATTRMHKCCFCVFETASALP